MNRFAQPRTQARALVGGRLLFAASLLALLAALAVAIAPGADAAPKGKTKQAALLPEGQQPNFVVIQTDDQTIDSLYATFTPPGGQPIPVMPNTLSLIGEKGFPERYYVPFPL
jgi:hypothetical protein